MFALKMAFCITGRAGVIELSATQSIALVTAPERAELMNLLHLHEITPMIANPRVAFRIRSLVDPTLLYISLPFENDARQVFDREPFPC
jgi:hypothetical protein